MLCVVVCVCPLSLCVLLLLLSCCACAVCLSVSVVLCVSVHAVLSVVCFFAGVGGGGCALCGRTRPWIGLYFFEYFLRKKKNKKPNEGTKIK